jgi:hypothetical protein
MRRELTQFSSFKCRKSVVEKTMVGDNAPIKRVTAAKGRCGICKGATR